ncbi:hypothetical protein [Kaistia nematophila]|uniref:Uncharacterized protein n=1 Tax=Kaistia nematophila TaxID=2994654 RepID=A0A9X3E2P9_9HYPH|nr:hypothetical protein [Kaistia nematophila]MCX5570641.1 hypothetical protein [Kaistia nematophila]
MELEMAAARRRRSLSAEVVERLRVSPLTGEDTHPTALEMRRQALWIDIQTLRKRLDELSEKLEILTDGS